MGAAILRRRRGLSVAGLRQRLAQAIEDALAALDALDADPDLEDGGDREHNLGLSENIDQTRWEMGADDEERSLGAPNPTPWTDQRLWSHGGGEGHMHADNEGEQQCEDEGAQCDDEGAVDAEIEPWRVPMIEVPDWPPAAANI